LAHAYTPGLRVTDDAVLRRERRLPLKGDVLAKAGDLVEPDTVVARTELPGNVQTVNLAARLSLDPANVEAALIRPVGSNRVESPADGTIEIVSKVTGQLILREPPIPVEMDAYVRGRVIEVLPGEGVVVEARGAFVQGIFGVGGETSGRIEVVSRAADEALRPEHLRPEHRGAVVVGGAHVSYEAVQRARAVGASAVVAGGLDDRDLKQLLGRDLGVAITGSEELGLTVVVTEGFGHIPMAARTWRLLGAHAGRIASISGATQIRAGVMRPEILIPGEGGAGAPAEEIALGLEVGSLLRVIRQPYFGRIGTVVGLPPELQRLDTEAEVRVLVVEFADDRTRAVVPRANVELISS
jgi:hypothetical protein